MSKENVEIARRVFAELVGGAEDHLAELDAYLTDERLAEFYDPEIEWHAASQSLLGVGAYRGYEGMRRFWTEFLSVWDEFAIEAEEFFDSGDNVAVVMHMAGRMKDIDFDETWSSLLTFRDGRVVRSEGFTTRDGARESIGL